MKIGLRLPQTDKNRATRENIIHLAQEAEDAGFDSLRDLERLICLLIHRQQGLPVGGEKGVMA